MSTTIYMIRHGESEGNRKRTFLGHSDWPLTQKGLEQAHKTAAFLHKNDKPNAIYASDLLRAYQTAEATAVLFDLPIQKERRLREIWAGEWEEMLFADIDEKFPKSYGIWREDIGNACPDGGESVAELQQRIVKIVTEIAQKHENQVVFLFTHATPVRVLTAHVLEKSLNEIKDIPWASNASVSKFFYDGEAFTLAEYGRDDFMGEIGTRLPSNI